MNSRVYLGGVLRSVRHAGMQGSRFFRKMVILGPFVVAESVSVAIYHYSPDARPAAVFAATLTAVACSLYSYLTSLAERRVGAAVDLMTRWNSHEFWRNRSITRKIMRHEIDIGTIMIQGRGEPLSDDAAALRDALIMECAFLETVALSIDHGRADDAALYDYFKRTVLYSYPTIERWIAHERKLWQTDSFFEHFEALYRRWAARERRRAARRSNAR